MLTISWLKNPDNVSYCKEEEMLSRLARELGISDLAERVAEFRAAPHKRGFESKREKTYYAEAVYP